MTRADHKLDGGVLYYALMVALVVATGLTSLIMYGYYNRQADYKSWQVEHHMMDVNSGIQLGMAMFYGQPAASKEVDLYGDQQHQVTLSAEQWGAFQIITSQSAMAPALGKSAMAGLKLDQEQALFVQDLDKPLSITGQTVIKGQAAVPRAGVKRAYIEGKNFLGRDLIMGLKSQSQRTLPKYNATIGQWAREQSARGWQADSVLPFQSLEPNQSIIQSFGQKAITIYSPGPIDLQRMKIKGKVIVCSNSEIRVPETATIDGAVLISPNIFIERRFKGACQLFGTDSVAIAEGAQLQYPSFVHLERKDGQRGTMVIEESALVKGGMLCTEPKEERTLPLYVEIQARAEVFGPVYCSGALDLKGSVYGSVTTHKFLLRTRTGIYENHLMDAVIDPTQLPENFIGGNILMENGKPGLMTWL